MFGFKLFHRKPRLILVQMSTPALHDLADRVHQRLRGRETDNPLQLMLEIAAEEAQHDANMAHIRQMAATMEQVNALPPRQRASLLDHMDGLTYKQIAKRRGMTERIVLRDLVRAFATLRMRMMENERDNGEPGRVQASVDTQPAGVWDSAPDVGVDSGVHRARAPGGGLSGGSVQQRSDASGEESGPHQSTKAS